MAREYRVYSEDNRLLLVTGRLGKALDRREQVKGAYLLVTDCVIPGEWEAQRSSGKRVFVLAHALDREGQ